ncbi:polyphosphate kinase 1, partial [Arthrospira platensis SPKY2]
ESFIGENDIFSLLNKQDVVLHHPYESFDHITQMIEQAASDPNVLSIKQTLYRVSSNSPIMAALIKAAKSGKQVICLLEIKARFNEAENLMWADKLEQAGGHVIYGVDNLKTHCKMTMIVKNTKKGLKTYCHLSTGNYNEVTGRIYTDISYFTSNNKISSDVSKLFNTLTGFSEPRLKKLISAPHNMRHELMTLIDKEIVNCKEGKSCGIDIKCNSIDDIGIIDKLYEASQAGVKINIVVRGICCLRTGQEYSKNIMVKSIVGRFLEHSRIYSFKASNKIYIGSADLMERNISRRFELLTPISDSESKARVRSILDTFINDDTAYVLEDRTYRKLEGQNSSQDIFMSEAMNVNRYKNINKIFIRKRK